MGSACTADENCICEELGKLFVFSDDKDFQQTSQKSKTDEDLKGQKRLRKLRRYEEIVAKRRLNRRNEHERRRVRQAAMTGTRQVQLPIILDVCIDFGFSSRMSDKERSRLVRQMGRVWALQKRFLDLNITLYSPCERFLSEGRRVLTGFDSFQWKIVQDCLASEVSQKPLVYLSPDPDLPPLMQISSDVTYIIGGLVDESGVGSLSRDAAGSLDACIFRLPIVEFMKRKEKGTFNLMLTINQVVEILAYFASCNSWVQSFATVLPPRIGYEPKE